MMTGAQSHGANVMVVDDTPENLRLLCSMLAERGCRVRAFPDGRMALQAAHKDPPEIMLVDVNMPGMNGPELCARIKESAALKDVPVLFISAAHEAETKLRAFASGGGRLHHQAVPFRGG